jgi:CRISPR-associated protein Csm3
MSVAVPTMIGRAVISGRIRVLTGLHIGAGKDSVEIGGIDNPVVRHPNTRLPYIPGSSIKGRLRYIMEWAFGKINVRKNNRGEWYGDVWGFGEEKPEPTDSVLRIFGVAGKGAWYGGPTRLLVRDAFLTDKWKEKAKEPTFTIVEEKNEVAIDRIAGKAMDGRLRTTERVPAGVEFDLAMIFRLFDMSPLEAQLGQKFKAPGREREYTGAELEYRDLAWLLQGLAFLEEEALGGSGSRGYGRIRFEGLTLRMPGWDRPKPLDDLFRGHPFSPQDPPKELFDFVRAVQAEA